MRIKYQNNKEVADAIRITWDSLRSHLQDTYDPDFERLKSEIAKKSIGSKKFHIKTIREYAQVILTLTKQLK